MKIMKPKSEWTIKDFVSQMPNIDTDYNETTDGWPNAGKRIYKKRC